MKIKKATIKDKEEFLKIKKEEIKEYKIILGKKIKKPEDKTILKDFRESLKNKKQRILFLIEEKRIKGYIHLFEYKNFWNSGLFIEDLFIVKEERRKGFAKRLLKEVEKIKKKKSLENISLNVSIKNKKAIKLYKKLGYKITHHTMKK